MKQSSLSISDNTPFGFIEFASESEIENTYRKYLSINSLYADPKFRKLGIGEQLLTVARDKSKDLGYDFLGLGALHKNTPALNLYKKFGFREYGIEFMLETK